tara:strand:- start:107 stop:358 length:252 start_codon:yes stop_codon:yes gene_type:complete
MFENFGTAIVQALGFFGIFGFFIYRLLSEKVSTNSLKKNTINKSSNPTKKVNTERKGFFGRKKNLEDNPDVKKSENKKGWFKR